MSGMSAFNSARFKNFISLFCLTLIYGCAGQVKMLPTLTEKTETLDQSGVLVARIINASGHSLPFNHITITPENLNESSEVKPQRLTSLSPNFKGSTVFGAVAEPGKYAFSDILSWYFTGQGSYSHFVAPSDNMGVFEVQKGRVTDIGTILYYTKPQGDKYLNVLMRLPYADNGEVLDKYFPFYNYDANEIISWQPDERDEDRESLYISIAQNPVIYTKQYVSPDNTVYLLGKLGVILNRTDSGEWQLDAVDTNLDLSAIAKSSQGQLVVGGTEGTLFYKDEIDGDWKDISISENAHIEHLAWSDTGLMEVVVARGNTLEILRGNPTEPYNSWESLNIFSSVRGEGWKHQSNGLEETGNHTSATGPEIFGIYLFELESNHYITVQTRHSGGSGSVGNIKDRTYLYDPKTWSIDRSIDDLPYSLVIQAGTVQIGIKKAGFFSWSTKPSFYRIDELGNRIKMATHATDCSYNDDPVFGCAKVSFNFQSVPWFSTPENAVAIAGFYNASLIGPQHKTETKLIRSNDGGATWETTGEKPPQDYCYETVPSFSDSLIVLCKGISSDIFESMDEGKTWNQTRQQENF